MAASILWYDLETFGTDPAYDRVAQFAAIRTTAELEIIPNAEHMLYCAPSSDYLPDPKSCLITGIGPQFCTSTGIAEYEFFSAIREIMLKPGTCSAGFNSIRFDDEFIRYGLYRNLWDPYEREYLDGNSRWDLLDVLRAASDLRPEGIVWPQNDDGRQIFRLESLTAANSIEHCDAHDALSDVRATIAMARLLREKQPRFFDWAWKHRTKDAVRRLVDIHKRLPFVHTSGMFSSAHGNTTLVAPLATMPGNPNCILCYDLRFEPQDLISMSPDEIRLRIFSKTEDLEQKGLQRIHIKGVHLNRSPFVAPVKILEEDGTAQKLGIDMNKCREHWRILQSEPLLMQKILKAYEKNRDFVPEADPDLSLYEGFLVDKDRTYLDAVHYEISAHPDQKNRVAALTELSKRLNFENRKLSEMVWRFSARNWPNGLSDSQIIKWKSFCASRLLMPPGQRLVNLDFYKRKIAEHMSDSSIPAHEKLVLKELSDWGSKLEREVLSWPEPA